MCTTDDAALVESDNSPVDVVRIARACERTAAAQLSSLAADLLAADEPEPCFLGRLKGVDGNLSNNTRNVAER